MLSLWAYLQGPHEALRWHDPATGRDLEDHDEVHDAHEAAEAELAEATAARETAESELTELRAQVRRLRNESGT